MWPMQMLVKVCVVKKKKKKNTHEITLIKYSESEVWRPILRICALHLTHPSAHT